MDPYIFPTVKLGCLLVILDYRMVVILLDIAFLYFLFGHKRNIMSEDHLKSFSEFLLKFANPSP